MDGVIRSCAVRRNRYIDSVRLMRLSNDLAHRPGVLDAFLVMGTEANRAIAIESGYPGDEVDRAGPDDLLVCVTGDTQEATSHALGKIDELLKEPVVARRIRSFDDALAALPGAGVVTVSVPGEFAADVARDALSKDLNVFLFSSNVALEDEIELKQQAAGRGLIVMGPDCGTSIISGIGLGFANGVRRGPIGVVGASGTGIQAVTTLVHRMGSGISHAIGVGARDLTDEVEGRSTFAALDALEDDEATEIVVVVAKKIGARVRRELEHRLQTSRKHVIECFLGPGAPTLEDTAQRAVSAVGIEPALDGPDRPKGILEELRRRHPDRRYIRGLFAGGTLCTECQMIMLDAGIEASSNVPLIPHPGLRNSSIASGHTVLDMGSETFTRRRPHPMIDPRPRIERLLREASDPETAVLLLDVVLGYGAASDPAGDLAPALEQVEELSGGEISLIASVCGTELDPQGLEQQIKSLQDAGASVFASNARATRAALVLAGVAP
jgi:FdrA protein